MPWAVGAGPRQPGSVRHISWAFRHRLPDAWPQTAGTCYPRLMCSAAWLCCESGTQELAEAPRVVWLHPRSADIYSLSCSPPSSVWWCPRVMPALAFSVQRKGFAGGAGLQHSCVTRGPAFLLLSGSLSSLFVWLRTCS